MGNDQSTFRRHRINKFVINENQQIIQSENNSGVYNTLYLDKSNNSTIPFLNVKHDYIYSDNTEMLFIKSLYNNCVANRVDDGLGINNYLSFDIKLTNDNNVTDFRQLFEPDLGSTNFDTFNTYCEDIIKTDILNKKPEDIYQYYNETVGNPFYRFAQKINRIYENYINKIQFVNETTKTEDYLVFSKLNTSSSSFTKNIKTAKINSFYFVENFPHDFYSYFKNLDSTKTQFQKPIDIIQYNNSCYYLMPLDQNVTSIIENKLHEQSDLWTASMTGNSDVYWELCNNEFDPKVQYYIGDIVKSNFKYYICENKPTIGVRPENSPDKWIEIINQWNDYTVYQQYDVVLYNQLCYRSLIDNNKFYEPSSTSASKKVHSFRDKTNHPQRPNLNTALDQAYSKTKYLIVDNNSIPLYDTEFSNIQKIYVGDFDTYVENLSVDLTPFNTGNALACKLQSTTKFDGLDFQILLMRLKNSQLTVQEQMKYISTVVDNLPDGTFVKYLDKKAVISHTDVMLDVKTGLSKQYVNYNQSGLNYSTIPSNILLSNNLSTSVVSYDQMTYNYFKLKNNRDPHLCINVAIQSDTDYLYSLNTMFDDSINNITYVYDTDIHKVSNSVKSFDKLTGIRKYTKADTLSINGKPWYGYNYISIKDDYLIDMLYDDEIIDSYDYSMYQLRFKYKESINIINKAINDINDEEQLERPYTINHLFEAVDHLNIVVNSYSSYEMLTNIIDNFMLEENQYFENIFGNNVINRDYSIQKSCEIVKKISNNFDNYLGAINDLMSRSIITTEDSLSKLYYTFKLMMPSDPNNVNSYSQIEQNILKITSSGATSDLNAVDINCDLIIKKQLLSEEECEAIQFMIDAGLLTYRDGGWDGKQLQTIISRIGELRVDSSVNAVVEMCSTLEIQKATEYTVYDLKGSDFTIEHIIEFLQIFKDIYKDILTQEGNANSNVGLIQLLTTFVDNPATDEYYIFKPDTNTDDVLSFIDRLNPIKVYDYVNLYAAIKSIDQNMMLVTAFTYLTDPTYPELYKNKTLTDIYNAYLSFSTNINNQTISIVDDNHCTVDVFVNFIINYANFNNTIQYFKNGIIKDPSITLSKILLDPYDFFGVETKYLRTILQDSYKSQTFIDKQVSLLKKLKNYFNNNIHLTDDQYKYAKIIIEQISSYTGETIFTDNILKLYKDVVDQSDNLKNIIDVNQDTILIEENNIPTEIINGVETPINNYPNIFAGLLNRYFIQLISPNCEQYDNLLDDSADIVKNKVTGLIYFLGLVLTKYNEYVSGGVTTITPSNKRISNLYNDILHYDQLIEFNNFFNNGIFKDDFRMGPYVDKNGITQENNDIYSLLHWFTEQYNFDQSKEKESISNLTSLKNDIQKILDNSFLNSEIITLENLFDLVFNYRNYKQSELGDLTTDDKAAAEEQSKILRDILNRDIDIDYQYVRDLYSNTLNQYNIIDNLLKLYNGGQTIGDVIANLNKINNASNTITVLYNFLIRVLLNGGNNYQYQNITIKIDQNDIETTLDNWLDLHDGEFFSSTNKITGNVLYNIKNNLSGLMSILTNSLIHKTYNYLDVLKAFCKVDGNNDFILSNGNVQYLDQSEIFVMSNGKPIGILDAKITNFGFIQLSDSSRLQDAVQLMYSMYNTYKYTLNDIRLYINLDNFNVLTIYDLINVLYTSGLYEQTFNKINNLIDLTINGQLNTTYSNIQVVDQIIKSFDNLFSGSTIANLTNTNSGLLYNNYDLFNLFVSNPLISKKTSIRNKLLNDLLIVFKYNSFTLTYQSLYNQLCDFLNVDTAKGNTSQINTLLTWDESTLYEYGDVVYYNQLFYQSIFNNNNASGLFNVGKNPENSSIYWTIYKIPGTTNNADHTTVYKIFNELNSLVSSNTIINVGNIIKHIGETSSYLLLEQILQNNNTFGTGSINWEQQITTLFDSKTPITLTTQKLIDKYISYNNQITTNNVNYDSISTNQLKNISTDLSNDSVELKGLTLFNSIHNRCNGTVLHDSIFGSDLTKPATDISKILKLSIVGNNIISDGKWFNITDIDISKMDIYNMMYLFNMHNNLYDVLENLKNTYPLFKILNGDISSSDKITIDHIVNIYNLANIQHKDEFGKFIDILFRNNSNLTSINTLTSELQFNNLNKYINGSGGILSAILTLPIICFSADENLEISYNNLYTFLVNKAASLNSIFSYGKRNLEFSFVWPEYVDNHQSGDPSVDPEDKHYTWANILQECIDPDNSVGGYAINFIVGSKHNTGKYFDTESNSVKDSLVVGYRVWTYIEQSVSGVAPTGKETDNNTWTYISGLSEAQIEALSEYSSSKTYKSGDQVKYRTSSTVGGIVTYGDYYGYVANIDNKVHYPTTTAINGKVYWAVTDTISDVAPTGDQTSNGAWIYQHNSTAGTAYNPNATYGVGSQVRYNNYTYTCTGLYSNSTEASEQYIKGLLNVTTDEQASFDLVSSLRPKTERPSGSTMSTLYWKYIGVAADNEDNNYNPGAHYTTGDYVIYHRLKYQALQDITPDKVTIQNFINILNSKIVETPPANINTILNSIDTNMSSSEVNMLFNIVENATKAPYYQCMDVFGSLINTDTLYGLFENIVGDRILLNYIFDIGSNDPTLGAFVNELIPEDGSNDIKISTLTFDNNVKLNYIDIGKIIDYLNNNTNVFNSIVDMFRLVTTTYNCRSIVNNLFPVSTVDVVLVRDYFNFTPHLNKLIDYIITNNLTNNSATLLKLNFDGLNTLLKFTKTYLVKSSTNMNNFYYLLQYVTDILNNFRLSYNDATDYIPNNQIINSYKTNMILEDIYAILSLQGQRNIFSLLDQSKLLADIFRLNDLSSNIHQIGKVLDITDDLTLSDAKQQNDTLKEEQLKQQKVLNEKLLNNPILLYNKGDNTINSGLNDTLYNLFQFISLINPNIDVMYDAETDPTNTAYWELVTDVVANQYYSSSKSYSAGDIVLYGVDEKGISKTYKARVDISPQDTSISSIMNFFKLCCIINKDNTYTSKLNLNFSLTQLMEVLETLDDAKISNFVNVFYPTLFMGDTIIDTSNRMWIDNYISLNDTVANINLTPLTVSEKFNLLHPSNTIKDYLMFCDVLQYIKETSELQLLYNDTNYIYDVFATVKPVFRPIKYSGETEKMFSFFAEHSQEIMHMYSNIATYNKIKELNKYTNNVINDINKSTVYSSTITYKRGSIVKIINNQTYKYYEAIQDNVINKNPANSPTDWIYRDDLNTIYYNYLVDAIELNGTDTIHSSNHINKIVGYEISGQYFRDNIYNNSYISTSLYRISKVLSNPMIQLLYYCNINNSLSDLLTLIDNIEVIYTLNNNGLINANEVTVDSFIKFNEQILSINVMFKQSMITKQSLIQDLLISKQYIEAFMTVFNKYEYIFGTIAIMKNLIDSMKEIELIIKLVKYEINTEYGVTNQTLFSVYKMVQFIFDVSDQLEDLLYKIIAETVDKGGNVVDILTNYDKSYHLTCLQTVFDDLNQFEQVERLKGVYKFRQYDAHKSNIYSINVKNSGLNITADMGTTEQQKVLQIRKSFESVMREYIKKYMPAHTHLWKINYEGR